MGTDTGYDFFDHTADIGIRAKGGTLAELFMHLAEGLTALIAEASDIEPREARPIQLTAADAESLLLAWLQELVFWFSTDRFLPALAGRSWYRATPVSDRRGEVPPTLSTPSLMQGKIDDHVVRLYRTMWRQLTLYRCRARS